MRDKNPGRCVSEARVRLDQALVQRGLAQSRHRARQLILMGAVRVAGEVVQKPAARVASAEQIEVENAIPYVGRGGLKLADALDTFGVDVAGKVVLDVGSSTGGFTDCLLQRGVRKVYAVDVGREQMDASLRGHPRVVLMEECDIRGVQDLPDDIDMVVIDVSFISLRLVLPAIARLLGDDRDGGEVIALVKPQFEAGPEGTNRRGVVSDSSVRQRAVDGVLCWAQENGWQVLAVMQSAIAGSDGNVEYLAHLCRTG